MQLKRNKEMKFEKLKKSHKKQIIIGTLAICVIGGSLTFITTRAKYRLTQDIELAKGIVNYKVPDLNMVAMYQENASGGWDQIDTAPISGYFLNTTQSQCSVEGNKDSTIGISYSDGKITISNLTMKGTKCYLYFDIIKDTTKPIISNVATSVTKTEISVTVTASDNVGITEYWYQLDNNAAVKQTQSSYKFTGLAPGSTHSIKVYVKDAAGNQSDITTKSVTTTANGIIVECQFSNLQSNFTYTYESETGTLIPGEAWTLMPGTIITVKTGQSLTFYDENSNQVGHAGGYSTETYAIQGNEKTYTAYVTCFTGKTELLAYDEKKKRKLKRKVKDFKVGDKLYTFDEKNNKFITTTIKKIDTTKTRDIYAIHLENNEVIRCSGGHSFYVANVGYLKADEIKAGVSLLGIDNNIKITKVEREHYDEEITLYNLYLDNNKNCFVTSAKVLSYMMTLSIAATYKKIPVVYATPID